MSSPSLHIYNESGFHSRFEFFKRNDMDVTLFIMKSLLIDLLKINVEASLVRFVHLVVPKGGLLFGRFSLSFQKVLFFCCRFLLCSEFVISAYT